jgi:hypothetical protein
LNPEVLAGKIVRKYQDISGKFISNIPNSALAVSDDDTPLIESGHEARNESELRQKIYYSD